MEASCKVIMVWGCVVATIAIGAPCKDFFIGNSCVAMRMNKKQPLHSSSSSSSSTIMVSNFFSIWLTFVIGWHCKFFKSSNGIGLSMLCGNVQSQLETRKNTRKEWNEKEEKDRERENVKKMEKNGWKQWKIWKKIKKEMDIKIEENISFTYYDI